MQLFASQKLLHLTLVWLLYYTKQHIILMRVVVVMKWFGLTRMPLCGNSVSCYLDGTSSNSIWRPKLLVAIQQLQFLVYKQWSRLTQIIQEAVAIPFPTTIILTYATWVDSDVILSFHISARCFAAITWSKQREVFDILMHAYWLMMIVRYRSSRTAGTSRLHWRHWLIWRRWAGRFHRVYWWHRPAGCEWTAWCSRLHRPRRQYWYYRQHWGIRAERTTRIHWTAGHHGSTWCYWV